MQEDELSGENVITDLNEEVLEPTTEVEENVDTLEAEIKDEIPEKFKGKEVADVVASYLELEKTLGHKNNEVGELRKLTDEILQQQLKEPTQNEPETSIDLDDLLENPNDVVTKAIDNNPTIAKLQEQMQQALIAEKRKGFEGKHTDWNDVLESGDFQSWVTSSPVRQQMFTSANQSYDYAVLDEVFSLYKDVRGVAKEKAETTASTKRKKALNDTSVEKGSTGEVTKKVYRRADLIRLKQTNPNRYSEMADEIYLAYQEGRVK